MKFVLEEYRLSHFLSHETLLKIYKQTILPAIDYGSIIWIDCSKVMSDKLERLQNQTLRSILKKDRKTCTQWLREKCHLLSLKNRRRFLRFQLVFKIVKRHNCPEHLENYIATRASLRLRSLKDDLLLNIPTARSTMGQKTFQYSAAKDWNRLPKELRDITNFNSCKTFIIILVEFFFVGQWTKLKKRTRPIFSITNQNSYLSGVFI